MPKLTAAEMIELVRWRYPTGAGWALLEQPVVRGPARRGTGYGDRLADALVMGLWKSNRYEVIGIEVKVSRADWLRELRDPEKAALRRYCDRWYLVVADEAMVRAGELPSGWGMLAPAEVAGVGGRTAYELAEIVPAPRLSPEPMDRPFLASVIRRAVETYTYDGRLLAAHERGVARVRALGEKLCNFLKRTFHDAEATGFKRRLDAYQQDALREAAAFLVAAQAEIDALVEEDRA